MVSALECYRVNRDNRSFTVSSSKKGGSSDRCELDSHADTSVAGANFVILSESGEYATVHSFSEETKPIKRIPIGSAATAFVDSLGETHILILHQCLLFGNRLDHSLLCPNQMRSFNRIVHDCPRQFDPQSTHSIRIDEGNTDPFSIPLKMRGIISYFTSYRPTEEQLASCHRIELTSDVPWEPMSAHFSAYESFVQPMVSAVTKNGDSLDDIQGQSSLNGDFLVPADIYNEDVFHQTLVASVNVRLDSPSDNIEPTIPSTIAAISSNERTNIITKEVLAKRWGISVENAQRTLQVTTQRGVRTFVNPTDRRFNTRKPHLVFPTMRGSKMYTDTMFANVKSIHKKVAAQVWTDGNGYCLFYPLNSKSQAHETIHKMVHDMQGIPEVIVKDGSKEQSSAKWNEEINLIRCRQHTTEPFSQWQNKAEAEIRELKRGIKRHTVRSRSPRRLWEYCGKWVAAIRRLTALSMQSLDGFNAYERVHARRADISEYAQFDWYQYVYAIDPSAGGLDTRRVLTRWIGVAEDFGSAMTYWVISKSAEPVARSSVMPVPLEDMLTDEFKAAAKELDDGIENALGDKVSKTTFDANFPNGISEPPYEIFDGDDDDPNPIEPESTRPDADDHSSPDAYDQYLTTNLLIDRGGSMERGTVVRRKRDHEGQLVGKSNTNPLLDTREYEVEFADGTIDYLSANIIAESMYSQVDSEGREQMLLDAIIDHRFDGNALSKDDAIIPGTNRQRRTTKGCQLLVSWKDGSTDWIPLADMKDSYMVPTAEYAVDNKIASEPCFAWWVPHTLKKRERIIKKIKTRLTKRTHKFGIELPRTVAEALEIDRRTGTTFWRDAIEKEMRNVSDAFEIREDNKPPPFHQLIRCHMIFDIKPETLVRKARFVAGGHMTDPPRDSVYSSVVSRDSVRLFFLIAALNDLDVRACDVQNAYINAGTKEKVYFIAGKELGEHEGKVVVIVRALYGLKSSGARFREHMAATLRAAGFMSCKADPDVWMKPARKADGELFYEYVLCYVDDILYGGLQADDFMQRLSITYKLKEGSVTVPTVYLGADIKRMDLGGETESVNAWGMSSDSYIKRAVKEVERELQQVGMSLAPKVVSPMSSGYRPELDSSPLLGPEKASYFMSLMGVLRWAIELGRLDIMVEAGLLSRFMAAPREGHLDQMFHIFAYLKKYNRSTVAFDWTKPQLDESKFTKCDWTENYPDAKEPIPTNIPEPRGKSVVTTCFVDADHAGCRLTRRSHTGVVIFVNRAPILWFSKRQNTVESSTFGSESVAMRQAVDMIEGLRYKLRMMGVPIEDATKIYCDNEAVVKSTSRPESTLKKKHNAINYHRVREAQAAGFITIAWVESGENLADVLTKVLVGEKRAYLLHRILW